MTRHKGSARDPHFLYRHFGEDGELLYVGITRAPEAREVTHRTTAPWRHLIASISYEMHPSKYVAEAHEQYEIETLVPPFNISHSPAREAAKERCSELAAWHRAQRPVDRRADRRAAEMEAIRAAGRAAAKDAPPLPDEVLAMLRADRFPVRRRSERGAA